MKNKKILIVEDEKVFRSMLEGYLHAQGMQVFVADNGQSALIRLTEENLNPDVILCDLNMPVMSGEDFMAELVTRNIHIPVIVISATTDFTQLDRMLRLGAKDALLKPIKNLEELKVTIQSNLYPEQYNDQVVNRLQPTLINYDNQDITPVLKHEGPRNPADDLGALFQRPEFDFSDYVLDHVEVHECNYNWKTFIEVYLEDYHVGPFHPGLGHFVTCDDLNWEFSDWFSLQRVGVHQALAQPGSDVYRQWHDNLMQFREGQAPDFGAIWVTYFPTHMIEIYPHVLVLSTLYPVSPQRTVNIVEFYYPEEIAAFEREFVEAQQAAYMETAIEDDEIAERMDAGRRALMERGVSEAGPYQSPMEDGMKHFHEWYRRIMGEPAPE